MGLEVTAVLDCTFIASLCAGSAPSHHLSFTSFHCAPLMLGNLVSETQVRGK